MAEIEFSKDECYFRDGDIVEFDMVSGGDKKLHKGLILGSTLDTIDHHPMVSGGFYHRTPPNGIPRWTVNLFDMTSQRTWSFSYYQLEFPWNADHMAEVYRIVFWVDRENPCPDSTKCYTKDI